MPLSKQQLRQKITQLEMKRDWAVPPKPQWTRIDELELDDLKMEWARRYGREWKSEAITIPVEKGDTVLGGKWKNKKIKIKSIGRDEHDMPTINGRKVVTFRIPKEVNEMKITKKMIRALIEMTIKDKLERFGGRYGGEPDKLIPDPGNRDVRNPVIQVSEKGGSNRKVRRPIP